MVAVTREAALADLTSLHSEFSQILSQLDGADWEAEGTIGGGDWSLRDLVGHIASWEQLALEAIHAAAQGRTPPVSNLSIDALNAEMVAAQRKLALSSLRQEAERTHLALVTAISEMDEELWEHPVTLGESQPMPLWEALGNILGAQEHLFCHLEDHLPDLRSFASAAGA